MGVQGLSPEPQLVLPPPPAGDAGIFSEGDAPWHVCPSLCLWPVGWHAVCVPEQGNMGMQP